MSKETWERLEELRRLDIGGGRRMPAVERWEYVTYAIGQDNDWVRVEAALSEMGGAGWELVAVTGNNTHMAFLKRRLPDVKPS
jgi:hypothetical protein